MSKFTETLIENGFSDKQIEIIINACNEKQKDLLHRLNVTNDKLKALVNNDCISGIGTIHSVKEIIRKNDEFTKLI